MFGYYGRKRRWNRYGSYPVRKYRRVNTFSRVSRPGRMSGFWPGTRASFRRVTLKRRIPGLGLIRRTYTIPELKYVDASATTPMDDGGTIYLLNGLQQGAGNQMRIGQRITMRSNHLKYYIVGTGTTGQAMSRIMLVLDMQPNGGLASLADIIEDANINFNIVSGLQMANSARFKVLWDKRYSTVGATGTIQDSFTQYDENFQKLNNEVQYSDTNAGDITDITSGALLLVTMSNKITGADQPNITFYNRVRYHDN